VIAGTFIGQPSLDREDGMPLLKQPDLSDRPKRKHALLRMIHPQNEMVPLKVAAYLAELAARDLRVAGYIGTRRFSVVPAL
jgi:hypothetical protein